MSLDRPRESNLGQVERERGGLFADRPGIEKKDGDRAIGLPWRAACVARGGEGGGGSKGERQWEVAPATTSAGAHPGPGTCSAACTHGVSTGEAYAGPPTCGFEKMAFQSDPGGACKDTK